MSNLPPISEWSVTKYDIPLRINDKETREFSAGSSLDIEDDEYGTFVGLGIYDPTKKACFYWSDFDLVRKLQIPKFIAHNGVTDINKLRKWGFNLDDSYLLFDTQLMAHVSDSSLGAKEYGLKALAKRFCNIEYPSYEDIVGKHKGKTKAKPKCAKTSPGCCGRKTLDKQPLDLVSNYNAMDCYATYKLWQAQTNAMLSFNSQGVNPDYAYMTDLEKPLSFIFYKMSERGVALDVNYLVKLEGDLSREKDLIEKEILNDLGSINLDSPKQLLEALHAKEIYPVFKNKPSTDKRALERLKGTPVVSRLLDYSEHETLLTNFVRSYLSRKTEVVHPNFSQTGTRTGRPSCHNPNLLQIPKRSDKGKMVRRMFKARPGRLFGECDYSKGEPRMWAHIYKDPVLLNIFNKGEDFYGYTQKAMGLVGEAGYNKAKVLNLSVGYRATFKSVSQQLGCSDSEAQREIDKWWGVYPGLHDGQERLIYQAKKDGYFKTLLGRRIRVEGLTDPNKWIREGAIRQLLNNIAQSSLGEVIKLAMIEIDKMNIELLVQVYDSLLFEEDIECMDKALEMVVDKMEHSIILDIPLEVSYKVGPTWSDIK